MPIGTERPGRSGQARTVHGRVSGPPVDLGCGVSHGGQQIKKIEGCGLGKPHYDKVVAVEHGKIIIACMRCGREYRE